MCKSLEMNVSTSRFIPKTAYLYDPRYKLDSWATSIYKEFSLSEGCYVFKNISLNDVLSFLQVGSSVEFTMSHHKRHEGYYLSKLGYFMGADLDRYNVISVIHAPSLIGKYQREDIPHIPISSLANIIVEPEGPRESWPEEIVVRYRLLHHDLPSACESKQTINSRGYVGVYNSDGEFPMYDVEKIKE
jgi:hypothetical protein